MQSLGKTINTYFKHKAQVRWTFKANFMYLGMLSRSLLTYQVNLRTCSAKYIVFMVCFLPPDFSYHWFRFCLPLQDASKSLKKLEKTWRSFKTLAATDSSCSGRFELWRLIRYLRPINTSRILTPMPPDTEVRHSYLQCPTPNIGTMRSLASYKILFLCPATQNFTNLFCWDNRWWKDIEKCSYGESQDDKKSKGLYKMSRFYPAWLAIFIFW